MKAQHGEPPALFPRLLQGCVCVLRLFCWLVFCAHPWSFPFMRDLSFGGSSRWSPNFIKVPALCGANVSSLIMWLPRRETG